MVSGKWDHGNSSDLHAVRKQLVALLEPKQLPTAMERRNERGGRIKEAVMPGEKGDKQLPGWSRASIKPSRLANVRRPATSAGVRDDSRGAGSRRGHEMLNPRSSSVQDGQLFSGTAGKAFRAPSVISDSLDLNQRPRPDPHTSFRADSTYREKSGEVSDSVIRDALEQASHDRMVLSGPADMRNGIRQGNATREVQAALLRQGAQEALTMLLSERDHAKGELRAAKAKVKDFLAVQKHLQRTIDMHEKDRVTLMSDRALGQRQIDSIQNSVNEILAIVERTVQHLHAHIQRVMHDAQTSLSKAQSEVTDEKSKLQAQHMVADKLSDRVLDLTAERDAARALAAQKDGHIAELLSELEQRDSVDEIRYDHECNVRDLQRRFTDKRADIVHRFACHLDGQGLHTALIQWRMHTLDARDASRRSRIRSQALELERANSEAVFWRNMYHEMHARTQHLLGLNSSPATSMDIQAVAQSAGTSASPAPTIHATNLGDAGHGGGLSTVEGLQREISSLRKTLEVVQEAKVDGQSTRGAAERVDHRIDDACAALESKQLQIVDLHTKLLALKGSVNPLGVEERLRDREQDRLREFDTSRARQKEREQSAQQKAAAEVEAQIFQMLASDQITFEANSAKLTDKGRSMVSRVMPAIRGLGRMVVEVHGHCKCDCGNHDLSHARAKTVADKLKEEGCENDFVIVPHADRHPEIKAQMLVRIIPRPGTNGPIGGERTVCDVGREDGAVSGSLLHNSSSSSSISSFHSDGEDVASQAVMEGRYKIDAESGREDTKTRPGQESGKPCDRSLAQSMTDIDSQILQHVASIKHEACLAHVQVQADAQMVSLETLKDLAQQREMQADTLLKAGKTQDAIGMFGKALELLVKLYGPDSAQAAPILINMATAMQRLKSFDEAEAKFTEALQVRRKHLGDDHALTQKVQTLLKRNSAAREQL